MSSFSRMAQEPIESQLDTLRDTLEFGNVALYMSALHYASDEAVEAFEQELKRKARKR